MENKTKYITCDIIESEVLWEREMHVDVNLKLKRRDTNEIESRNVGMLIEAYEKCKERGIYTICE